MTRDEIIEAIRLERIRQENLHPDWPASPSRCFLILAEEVGEVAEAINEGLPKQTRRELIESAATCFRWLENML